MEVREVHAYTSALSKDARVLIINTAGSYQHSVPGSGLKDGEPFEEGLLAELGRN